MQVKEKEGVQQKGVEPSRGRMMTTRAPRCGKECAVTVRSDRGKRWVGEEIKEKAYLETNCAANRQVFCVLEEVIVTDGVIARIEIVTRVGFASSTQRVADAEAHVGPSLGDDGVAGAAR
jgi:hypothetical protein